MGLSMLDTNKHGSSMCEMPAGKVINHREKKIQLLV